MNLIEKQHETPIPPCKPRFGLVQLLRPVSVFLTRHRDTLWWLHSAWALLFGIGVMWLGARNYNYLRVTVFHIAFIWCTSLLLPGIAGHPRLTPAWNRRLRMVTNYFHRNLYQQLLFFVLPIYYGSCTFWSRNFLFVVLLAVSALLATLDVIYDEILSAKWSLSALFFGFSLFAIINVMLPVLWGISNTWALRLSAAIALIGFATLCFRLSWLTRRQAWKVIWVGGILLVLTVELGRSFIPPAPLRLVKVDFGTSVERRTLQVSPPIGSLPVGWSGKVYALTAIKAPLGLEEKVGHRWYADGRLVYASSFYSVTGGRQEGFRLWTSNNVKGLSSGDKLKVEVVTEGGQLIGRASLRIQ